MLSQLLVQQNESAPQTMASHAPSSHPIVPLDTQQSPLPMLQLPQSVWQLSHDSAPPQVPSPQLKHSFAMQLSVLEGLLSSQSAAV